jgi:hypothetical protein
MKRQSVMEKLREAVIRAIGDRRECPLCKEGFIPEDRQTSDLWKAYRAVFGTGGKNT